MPKINRLDIYGPKDPVEGDDYVIGTRASDGVTKNFRMRDILDYILLELGLPRTGIKTIVATITETGDTIQSDFLIGATAIKAILSSNQAYTAEENNFPDFPDFELNSETGTITGFPVSAGQEVTIIFDTLPQEDEA